MPGEKELPKRLSRKEFVKGAAVGEAIDELRMEKLRKLEFKERLSGHQL